MNVHFQKPTLYCPSVYTIIVTDHNVHGLFQLCKAIMCIASNVIHLLRIKNDINPDIRFEALHGGNRYRLGLR